MTWTRFLRVQRVRSPLQAPGTTHHARNKLTWAKRARRLHEKCVCASSYMKCLFSLAKERLHFLSRCRDGCGEFYILAAQQNTRSNTDTNTNTRPISTLGRQREQLQLCTNHLELRFWSHQWKLAWATGACLRCAVVGR